MRIRRVRPADARSYVNDPNVRIGGDRLKIFEDQAVFVPIIIALLVKV